MRKLRCAVMAGLLMLPACTTYLPGDFAVQCGFDEGCMMHEARVAGERQHAHQKKVAGDLIQIAIAVGLASATGEDPMAYLQPRTADAYPRRRSYAGWTPY